MYVSSILRGIIQDQGPTGAGPMPQQDNLDRRLMGPGKGIPGIHTYGVPFQPSSRRREHPTALEVATPSQSK